VCVCLVCNRTKHFSNFCLESSADSDIDLLMDKLGGETATVDDLEACKNKKKRRRRRILYNLFDFLAIMASMLSYYF
jgi:hypothetical protein